MHRITYCCTAFANVVATIAHVKHIPLRYLRKWYCRQVLGNDAISLCQTVVTHPSTHTAHIPPTPHHTYTYAHTHYTHTHTAQCRSSDSDARNNKTAGKRFTIRKKLPNKLKRLKPLNPANHRSGTVSGP